MLLSPPFFSDLLGKNLDRPEGHTVQHRSNKGSGLLQLLFPLPGHVFQTKPLSIYLPIYLFYTHTHTHTHTHTYGLWVLFRNPWFQKTTFQIPPN